MMKQSIFKLLLIMLSCMMSSVTFGHDFSATYNGKTIYYKIISSANKTVAVSFRGAYYYSYFGESYSGSITIPNTVYYNGTTYTVTSIDGYAFSACTNLTSVVIPNSVSTIGEWAFTSCSNLSNVVIPNSVTSIGEQAFAACPALTSIEIPNNVTCIEDYTFSRCSGLMSIEIPNGVTSIGENAFYGCSSLTSIEFPNSVTRIGTYAFCECVGLTSIKIPKSVISIENVAFLYCSGLTSIIVETGNAKYDSRGNCNAIIEKSTNTLILGCQNTVIPESVTKIGNQAFGRCSGLTSIKIPNSVTNIDTQAFYNCSGLTSIEIPNSVTSIGISAFSGCSGLSKLEIPNSVTSIGENAFSSCSGLTSIIVDTGNTKFDSRGNCNAIIEKSSNTLIVGCQNTVIPESVNTIGNDAFSGCSSLTNIEIPNTVTSIGYSAFGGCSGLTSVEIPNSITSLESSVFGGCTSLTSIKIPSSVTSIGYSAFSGCIGLTSLEIPNSVTGISLRAFADCTGLKSIKIPDSVVGLGVQVFDDCSNLTEIHWKPNANKDLSSNLGNASLTSKSRTLYLYNTLENSEMINTLVSKLDGKFKEIVVYSNQGINLSASNITCQQSHKVQLPIVITNDGSLSIVGVSFTLALPDGVTLVTNGREPLYELNSDRLNPKWFSVLTTQNSDGSWEFNIVPNNNSAVISGTDGEVMTITLFVEGNMEIGDYDIQLTQNKLSIKNTSANVQSMLLDDATFKLTVSEAQKGDVNGDDEVDLSDAIMVIYYSLGEAPSNFAASAADMNGDGEIDLSDAITIIYTSLGVYDQPSTSTPAGLVAVDLGLPSGTKWANMNVGASKPEDYGGYYAWGETEEKEVYNWSTYIHCNGSWVTCHDLGSDIAGTEYDVAHVKWGGDWVMPTRAQQDELRNNCTYEWTTINGVYGGKFTGPNGNSIFLPAAGYRWNESLDVAGSYGYYWSSTQYPSYSDYAYYLDFYSDDADWYCNYRDGGRSVRPVVRN